MTRRRTLRRSTGPAWIVFLGLLAVCLVFADELLGPLRDEPAPAGDGAVGDQAAATPNGVVDAATDAGLDDGAALGELESAAADAGPPGSDAGPTGGGTPGDQLDAARDDFTTRAPADASSDGASPPPADATVGGDDAEDADLATALARGRDLDGASAADAPAADVQVDRTATGMRRYSARLDDEQRAAAEARLAQDTTSSARPRAEDEALRARRKALETLPTQPDLLDELVAQLVARHDHDEALEWVARFLEAGGDAASAQAHADLDPFATRRVALLRAGAAGLLDVASVARGKARWIVTAAQLDRARLLAEAARDPLGDSGDPRAAERLDDLLVRERDALLARRDAVERLAAFGAPLPPDVAPGRTSLQRARDDAADARAAARGEPVEARAGRVLVRTDLGSALAEDAARLLDAVHARLAAQLGHDPLRSGEPVIVEILADAAAWETRRTRAEPSVPPWRRAFLVGADVIAGGEAGGSEAPPERRIAAVDPLAVGEPRELLAGRLARELARLALRSASAERLPLWLEEGFVCAYEGARLRGDGSVDLERPAAGRRQQLLLSRAGRGTPPRDLRELLDLDLLAAADVPWAWGLVSYLRHALGDDGAPLWRERWLMLLDATRAGDAGLPLAAFVQYVLEGGESDDEFRADVQSLTAFETRWHAWIADEAALDRGEASAVHRALTRITRALDRGDVQRAEDVVRRVLAARPDEALALQLAVRTADARGDHDGALLAALALAQARQPSGAWSLAGGQQLGDLDQRAFGEELRFAEAWSLQDDVAAAAAAADLALRVAVEGLVAEQLAAGYPRAAVRLLDDVLAAAPLDAGYRAMRARIVEARLEPHDLVVRRRVETGDVLRGAHGDLSLWEAGPGRPGDAGPPTEVLAAIDADGRLQSLGHDVLLAHGADRLQPSTLDGLLQLTPPCRVAVRLEFVEHPTRGHAGDETTWAGLTLGARDPIVPGPWAVLVSPGGRVKLATRGNFEWPGQEIGRGERGALELEIELTAGGFEIFADGRSLGAREYGPRPGAGWLGLFARHVDVAFQGLEVRRTRGVDPRGAWWLGGGE